MSQRLATLLAWICLLVIVGIALGSAYYLFNLNGLQALLIQNISLPIQWQSLETWQFYTVWAISAGYLAVGLMGLGYLRNALRALGKGEFFSLATSQSLRRFSIYLMLQAAIQPIYMALLSVVLSFNHPAGKKILSLSLGSNELKLLSLGIIFWIFSDLLVKARLLEQENQKFI